MKSRSTENDVIMKMNANPFCDAFQWTVLQETDAAFE